MCWRWIPHYAIDGGNTRRPRDHRGYCYHSIRENAELNITFIAGHWIRRVSCSQNQGTPWSKPRGSLLSYMYAHQYLTILASWEVPSILGPQCRRAVLLILGIYEGCFYMDRARFTPANASLLRGSSQVCSISADALLPHESSLKKPGLPTAPR